MLPYFAAHEVKTRPLGDDYEADFARYVSQLPRTWKELPPLRESRSYLLSWLAGYFAADGCVTPSASARLDSSSRENLEFVRSVAAICGVGHGPIRAGQRVGKGKVESAIFSITLDGMDLPAWFWKIEHHAERVEARRRRQPAKPTRAVGFGERLWRVESVTDTGVDEEVFCAIVPGAQAFALTEDLVTGNCVVCVLAGDAQVQAGIRHNRDLALEYVAVERRMGHTFKANRSIESMVDDVLGVPVPVSLGAARPAVVA